MFSSYLTLDNFTTTFFDMENVYECHTYCLAGGMHTINLNIFLFLVILIHFEKLLPLPPSRSPDFFASLFSH